MGTACHCAVMILFCRQGRKITDLIQKIQSKGGWFDACLLPSTKNWKLCPCLSGTPYNFEWVCDKNVGILKTPLWQRGARGDFKKIITTIKSPFIPLCQRGNVIACVITNKFEAILRDIFRIVPGLETYIGLVLCHNDSSVAYLFTAWKNIFCFPVR